VRAGISRRRPTPAAAAAARTFGGLLAAFVIFFPASGAFVSLTQAGLMDAAAGRQAQLMARWTVAGAIGAAAAGAAWLGLAGSTLDRADGRLPAGDQPLDITEESADDARPWPARLREAAGTLRDGSVLRWLILLEVADLLLDVFTGFAAIYLVVVAGVSPARAALGIGVRLAADLAGSAALIPVLERVPAGVVLRVSAATAVVAYPAFLLVPGFWPKVAALAVLSFATAAWYPVLQAELYRSLPGRSGTAVSLLSAAGLVGGLGPLAVGLLAGQLGLGGALGLLAVVPVCVLCGTGLRWPSGE